MPLRPPFRLPLRALPLAVLLARGALWAAPYSLGLNDPTNVWDAPVPGFIGPDGEGKARLDDGFGGFYHARNFVNPIFFGWAQSATDYVRADGQTAFSDPALALGPVTGDYTDVVSLGDLSAAQIAAAAPVGKLTLHLTDALHPAPLRDLPGADFVVFENGVASGGGGRIFGELAYVEVSSDGIHFARFPSVSLTSGPVGPYGTIDPTNVFNLAGKHVNNTTAGVGDCWGTPFDLAALAADPLVTAGLLDLANVRHIRIVDIPGNGSFLDSATPAHPIYDPWLTTGSGGFDLEAIGVISAAMTFDEWQDFHGLTGPQRGPLADPDGDGVPNLIEFALGLQPLVPDAELLPAPVAIGADFAISFRRDTRALNLIVEVLAAAAPDQPWQIIARATGGGPLLAVGSFSPVIEDASDSPIASIGVIRRARVHAVPGRRFLKISVSVAL